MNHTPGPWEASIQGGRFVLAKTDDGSLLQVAEVYGRTPQEADANVHLFATATDLLNLTHAAFHALKSYEYGNASPDLARDCAAALDEAIARAEGRS